MDTWKLHKLFHYQTLMTEIISTCPLTWCTAIYLQSFQPYFLAAYSRHKTNKGHRRTIQSLSFSFREISIAVFCSLSRIAWSEFKAHMASYLYWAAGPALRSLTPPVGSPHRRLAFSALWRPWLNFRSVSFALQSVKVVTSYFQSQSTNRPDSPPRSQSVNQLNSGSNSMIFGRSP